jgi:hypothetical protein
MASCEELLSLRTSRLRRTALVRQAIGIAAPKLLKEIRQRKQLWVDTRLRIGEHMDRFVVSCNLRRNYHLGKRHALWLSTMLLCCSLTAPAQTIAQPGDTGAPFSCQATHVLGFANAKNDSTGTLSVQRDLLQFQQNGKPGVPVKLDSVRDLFLGGESRQIGGLPMTLGKVAAPYGGGRVVSLFAHKKYDTLSLEYVDSDGGIHGAIFQLKKGQAEIVKSEILAQGVTLSSNHVQSATQGTPEVGHENK